MTLVLFPLVSWSLMPEVSGFKAEELKRITDYVQRTYEITGQYAYTVKFDAFECRTLSNQDIKNALKDDKARSVRGKVLKREIYEGTRLTMASYKDLGNNRREHAEYRLLYPASGSNVSPVQNLLNKRPPAGCVVFFTFNSPCQAYCTKPNGPYNIVDELDQFHFIDNKAFVYKQVYKEPNVNVCCPTDRLRSIDDMMRLYRCDRTCRRCFSNGVFKNYCSN